MRWIFSDGWNSFWHLAFGILAYKFEFIIVLFLAYQLLLGKGAYEPNVTIDLLEFFIGYGLIFIFASTLGYVV